MRLVYYSLLPDARGRHEAQWAESVASLRRHNARIAICLVVHGRATPFIVETARRHDVTLVPAGDYGKALAEVSPEWCELLAFYPTFHKWLSLRLLPSASLSQLLYLDCDTYFFGDVAQIFDGHSVSEWYAREEPRSRRSPYGYDPMYLDESRLEQIAQAEGLELVPPYNTGVIVLNHGIWIALASLTPQLLSLAGRLMLGIDRRALPHYLAGLERVIAGSAFERKRPLPYPSSNAWLTECIALWLSMGNIPGLTHDLLSNVAVLQNGEFRSRTDETIVVHYFSSLEAAFFRSFAASGT
jgi:hypothetical protein